MRCRSCIATFAFLHCGRRFLPKSCAATIGKLHSNIEKTALQESGAFQPLSCGFQAPTFRLPCLGPAESVVGDLHKGSAERGFPDLFWFVLKANRNKSEENGANRNKSGYSRKQGTQIGTNRKKRGNRNKSGFCVCAPQMLVTGSWEQCPHMLASKARENDKLTPFCLSGGHGCLGEGRLGLPGQVWEVRFLPSFPSFPGENRSSMSGRTPGSPTHPSSRHPRPSEPSPSSVHTPGFLCILWT